MFVFCRSVETLGNIAGGDGPFASREAIDDPVEGDATHEPHRVVAEPFVLAKAVDGDDVRMPQAGRRASALEESSSRRT